MKVLALVGLSLVLVFLPGCMKGSYAEVAHRSAAELQDLPTHDLVATYGVEREFPSLLGSNEPKLRNEIVRRNIFSPEQWAMIDAKEIRIGQPELLVWASWGRPDDISESVSAFGKSRGLWYSKSTTWVWTDGEKITGWAD